MKTRIVSQLLEKADITAKNNKKSTCAKKYKFKKEIKNESAKVEKIEELPKIDEVSKNQMKESDEKITSIIKEYFNNIVKEFYINNIKIPNAINEKINSLELDDEEIFPLISQIQDINEKLSMDDSMVLIEKTINEFNTNENISNILNVLSESKKLPLSFSEYRKKALNNQK